RFVIERYLRAWKMTSASAAGADDALAIWEDARATGRPFDVALLDLNMPGTDGIALARLLRSTRGGIDARMVLLTSSNRRGDAVRAREAGIDAYLAKPVRRSLLLDTIATVMGQSIDREDDLAPAAPTPASGRVLVAEDNEVNQEVATRMLRAFGYNVDVASNGLEAVQAVLGGRYDAVLMDCQMPVMDGYLATTEIRRQEPDDRRTPIIAVTAGAMRTDAQRCLDAGMDDYVTKPVSRDELRLVLARWIPTTADGRDGAKEGTTPISSGTTMASAPPTAVLDPDVVADLHAMDGGGGEIHKIVTVFRQSAPQRLAALRAAVTVQDESAAAEAAHLLRGSSAIFGGHRVAALCAALESDIERGAGLSGADDLLTKIEAELMTVCVALDGAFPASAMADSDHQ
ncbi:MAG TPA: response regulator, partial [Acidimicrobiales bacterium]|nr:response regulator [Acidimicrobiales bacterium]